MPTSSHAFFLFRTYVCESFRSPTSTTASPGTFPHLAFSPSTSALSSCRIVAAVSLPSMISVWRNRASERVSAGGMLAAQHENRSYPHASPLHASRFWKGEGHWMESSSCSSVC